MKHFSIVIIFFTEEITLKIERSKLIIAENSKYKDKYTQNKLTDQYTKCQDFKHFSFKYKRDTKYEICADSYFMKNYSYSICKIITENTYTHTILKCVNCQMSHRVISKNCEKYKLVILNFKDSLDIKLQVIHLQINR